MNAGANNSGTGPKGWGAHAARVSRLAARRPLSLRKIGGPPILNTRAACAPLQTIERLASESPAPPAFTITELLVAMAILMVISGLLLSMVSSVSNAWAMSQQDAERQRAARVALDLINRDMAQAIISTNATAPIHFYGLSTAAYFIATSPSQSDSGSDMVEVGYVFNAATGKLYRYYTTNEAPPVVWNPRDTGAIEPTWRWPNVQTTAGYSYNTEADTLVAEGIADLQFVYSGPHTNNAVVWSNSVPGWVTTNSGTSGSFPGGAYLTDTLPAVVDIYLTVLPISKWTNNTAPNYTTLTNQYSRTFQATVNITRGGF